MCNPYINLFSCHFQFISHTTIILVAIFITAVGSYSTLGFLTAIECIRPQTGSHIWHTYPST